MASTSDELFAAIDAGDTDRVRGLVEADRSLASARDDKGVSALMRARYRLNMALARTILARVDQLDVFEAACFDDLDRLTQLLNADPSLVGSRSPDGFTPLHLAAFFGALDAARLLIARGADADSRGEGWMTGTPLHSAAAASHQDIVGLLLEAGADPNARQSAGWTPLHSAAHNGDAGTVRLLLDHGADPAFTSDEGRDAASLARETGDEATIALLAGQAER